MCEQDVGKSMQVPWSWQSQPEEATGERSYYCLGPQQGLLPRESYLTGIVTCRSGTRPACSDAAGQIELQPSECLTKPPLGHT